MPEFTTSEGTRLHYEEGGRGPAVLLIHGLGSSALDWEHQIAHLGEHYRVIAPDLRGHGRSAVPEAGYSIPRFSIDLGELLDALDIDHTHVVGVSMGGAVAFQLALDRPGLVASLCIVNSGPTAKTRDPRMLAMLLLRRLLARFAGPAKTAPAIADKLFPAPEMAAQRKTFIERIGRSDPVAYRKSLAALLRFDAAGRIGSLAMPTLFLCSEFDYLPPQSRQRYVDAMPDARLEIVPGAHHALPMEYPALCNTALDRFLQACADA